jgi:hypothetical protein
MFDPLLYVVSTTRGEEIPGKGRDGEDGRRRDWIGVEGY